VNLNCDRKGIGFGGKKKMILQRKQQRKNRKRPEFHAHIEQARQNFFNLLLKFIFCRR